MNVSGTGGFNWAASATNKNQNRQVLPDTSGVAAADNTVRAGTTGSTTGSSAAAIVKKSADDGVQKFKDYMKQSPQERMQYAWLAQHGVSKEQFDAMSPDDKRKLMDEMKQDIERKIKQQAEDGANHKPVDITV